MEFVTSRTADTASATARETRTADVERHKEAVRTIAELLRRNELQQVRELFIHLLQSDSSRASIARLENAFSQTGRLGLLLDLLLSAKDTAFNNLAIVTEAFSLGTRLNRESEVEEWVRSQRQAPDHQTVCWDASDYVHKILPRRHSAAHILRELKYPDLPDIRNAADLIGYGEKLAARIRIDQRLLDYLYSQTKLTSLPRDVWEQRVRTAFCIDHITTDTRLDTGWHTVLDPDASRDALAEMDPTKGTLLVLMHGGFAALLTSWLKNAVPDHVRAVGDNKSRSSNPERAKGRVYTREDSRAALFAFYRALQDRGTVVMAADARIGALTSSINVLGTVWPIAEGPAFLAYESGCNTAWCMVARQGNQFFPRIVPAPAPRAAETYDAFKGRLFAFYSEQIEALLTGDPDNIAVKHIWTRALTQGI